MFDKIKNFFLKELYVSQIEITHLLNQIYFSNRLNFLRQDEIETYEKSLRFLHDAASYVGCTVCVLDANEKCLHVGYCNGYGSLVNNVMKEDDIACTTRLFYSLICEGQHVLVNMEEGWKIVRA